METVLREAWLVEGVVQGVGFRPFVYRIATKAKLTGFVRNGPEGVRLEIEGSLAAIEAFTTAWQREMPSLAHVRRILKERVPVQQSHNFEIRPSEAGKMATTLIPADVAMCADCKKDVFDIANRHYRYPFTNCSNCGPRFSVIESLPYDRARTSMKSFALCPDCKREYDSPSDRRFHAQPLACPACGPMLEFWDALGKKRAEKEAALVEAILWLSRGRIVAVKGIGGFHLMVDAKNESGVNELRRRKQRGDKPFAVLFENEEQVAKEVGALSDLEREALFSPAAPIVLLEKKEGAMSALAPGVAPKSGLLGAMMAYSPLHALLVKGVGGPLVATSGNRSEEPICIDEKEALERLGSLADAFLVHNRPIVRSVEDSIVRIMDHRIVVVRRSRGFAPLPLDCGRDAWPCVLGVGGQLKNTIALARKKEVFLSAHHGDLENLISVQAFKRAVADLPRMLDCVPAQVACDLHPDYAATKFALETGLQVTKVQHHAAHVLSVMAEHQLKPPVFGISFDGTGYGLDQSVWGGEFFEVKTGHIVRVGKWRPFLLPGNEKAVREPWRCAIGLLFEMDGKKAFKEADYLEWSQKWKNGKNAFERYLLANAFVRTSSIGRLFDGVAGFLGMSGIQSFEAEAASQLEFLALKALHQPGADALEPYAATVRMEGENKKSFVIDWEPMMRAIRSDHQKKVGLEEIALRFHKGLALAAVESARAWNIHDVVLSGGCFVNKVLLEETVRGLREKGFRVFFGQNVPLGDGGLALGQVVATAEKWEVSDACV